MRTIGRTVQSAQEGGVIMPALVTVHAQPTMERDTLEKMLPDVISDGLYTDEAPWHPSGVVLIFSNDPPPDEYRLVLVIMVSNSLGNTTLDAKDAGDKIRYALSARHGGIRAGGMLELGSTRYWFDTHM